MEDQASTATQTRPTEEVEVSLVFRHFHPILAGAAERFRRYSLPLAKHGVGFRVFTLKEGEGSPETEEMHSSLHVKRLAAQGSPWERDAALFEAAWRELSAKSPRGHLLQTSLAHSLSAVWLRKLRAHGTACLYVGTMVAKEELEGAMWRLWLRKWRNRRNYAPFQRVIASTTVMARWFEKMGIRGERIEVIPNGVDVERFQPVTSASEKTRLREVLGLPATSPIVIFAGSIVPRKGVDLLIRAWAKVHARVPEAKLVLVGGFQRPTFMTQGRMQELSSFQVALRALAEAPEYGGSVAFPGETPCLEQWLCASDVFVFPSEQEGMGNVVLEAMACGLPSVITEFHGMPEKEFGTAGREFYAVQRNEDALAEGLLRMIINEAAANNMSVAARAWAAEHMDVKLTIERYAKLYHFLASGKA